MSKLRRGATLLLTILFILPIVFCGCERKRAVIETGEYWKIEQVNGFMSERYEYTVYDGNGEILLTDSTVGQPPEISLQDYFDVRIETSDGKTSTVRYVDTYSAKVSDVYEPLAETHSLLGYGSYIALLAENDGGKPVIVVRIPVVDHSTQTFELPFSEGIQPDSLIRGAAFDDDAGTLVVIYLSGEKQEETAAVLTIGRFDWSKNPIDEFYRKYYVEGGSTLSDQLVAGLYRDAWYNELEHAYQLLEEEANPQFEWIKEEIETSREAFMRFADAHAVMATSHDWSNAYDDIGIGGSVHFGSGATEGTLLIEGELYRDQALRLYAMMEDSFESVDEAFAFDEAELLEKIKEVGTLGITCVEG